MEGATILPARKEGTFTVCTRREDASRTITMQADSDKLKDATAWVVALKNAAIAGQNDSPSVGSEPTLSEKAAMLSIHDEGDDMAGEAGMV